MLKDWRIGSGKTALIAVQFDTRGQWEIDRKGSVSLDLIRIYFGSCPLVGFDEVAICGVLGPFRMFIGTLRFQRLQRWICRRIYPFNEAREKLKKENNENTPNKPADHTNEG